MKKKDLDKLQELIENSLGAHVLADWGDSKVRLIIANIIVKRFKKYLNDD
jgi:hypothetical protein